MAPLFSYQYRVLIRDAAAAIGGYRVIAVRTVQARNFRHGARKALAIAMLTCGKTVKVEMLDHHGRLLRTRPDHGEMEEFRASVALLCPTRAAVAGAIGLKYDTLQQYLNGRRNVPVAVREVLAEALRDQSQNLLNAASALEGSDRLVESPKEPHDD